MKKYLLMVFVLCCFSFPVSAAKIFSDTDGFIIAKAVKLGRGRAYSIDGTSTLNSGKTELSKNCDKNCADCNTDTGTCSACKSGYYLLNGSCKTCPANATCDGGNDYVCYSQYRKTSSGWLGICSGVTCKSGFTAVAHASSCCCESDGEETPACSAGTYISGSSCIACSNGTNSSKANATTCKTSSTLYVGSNNA